MAAKVREFLSAVPRPGHKCRLFESHEWGVFAGIDIEDYHSGPGVSSSAVKFLCGDNDTPAHFHARYILGYQSENDTKALRNGKAIHCLIEDPTQKLFEQQFIVRPTTVERYDKKLGGMKTMACNGTTVEGKALAARAIAENKTLIEEVDYKIALDCVNSLYEYKPFLEMVDHPDRLLEPSVYAQCPYTGMTLKCRPDIWVPGWRCMDYKSAVDAGPITWARAAGKNKYHIQQAFYEMVLGDQSQFSFMVLEKRMPFLPAQRWLDDFSVVRAIEKVKSALVLMAQCYETSEWLGYTPEVVEIPRYALQ